MASVEKRKYWKEVETCLIQVHGFSPPEAQKKITSLRRRIEKPSDGYPASDLIYDFEPEDLAREIAVNYFEQNIFRVTEEVSFERQSYRAPAFLEATFLQRQRYDDASLSDFTKHLESFAPAKVRLQGLPMTNLPIPGDIALTINMNESIHEDRRPAVNIFFDKLFGEIDAFVKRADAESTGYAHGLGQVSIAYKDMDLDLYLEPKLEEKLAKPSAYIAGVEKLIQESPLLRSAVYIRIPLIGHYIDGPDEALYKRFPKLKIGDPRYWGVANYESTQIDFAYDSELNQAIRK